MSNSIKQQEKPSRRMKGINAFSPVVCEKLGFYVYRLIDPENQKVFYVGKGTGNRVFAHINEAIKNEDAASLKLSCIRSIKAKGMEVGHIIHRHGLAEKEAFEVEAALIDAYPELTNAAGGTHSRKVGVMSVVDIMALYDARPIKIVVPSIIININRQWHAAMSAKELYDATRISWACKPDRHPKCRYAFCIKDGVIREVYEIKRWYTDPNCPAGKRQMFDGKVAEDMNHFIGRSVRGLYKTGAQNPIKWINC